MPVHLDRGGKGVGNSVIAVLVFIKERWLIRCQKAETAPRGEHIVSSGSGLNDKASEVTGSTTTTKTTTTTTQSERAIIANHFALLRT